MRQVHRLFQRFSLIVAMLFASIVAALAQNTIRGTILDAGGEPLIGATVVMKGKPSVAAVTDFDGNFELKTPAKKVTLVVSYVGMVTKEVVVVEGHAAKIVLKDEEHTQQ